MTGKFYNIRQSCLKICKDFISDTNNTVPNWSVFDFDAHAVENSLPSTNLVGIGEFSITAIGKGLYSASFYMAVCTTAKDSGLKDMIKSVDLLFDNYVGPMRRYSVYDDTATPVGIIIVKDGSTVLPVANTEGRPQQLIAVEVAVSLDLP